VAAVSGGARRLRQVEGGGAMGAAGEGRAMAAAVKGGAIAAVLKGGAMAAVAEGRGDGGGS
jgi:hypothetical protein